MRIALVVMLLGCQGVKVEGDAATPSATCTKLNDPCMFEPGKLGLCIDGNVTGQGPAKLICQSQH